MRKQCYVLKYRVLHHDVNVGDDFGASIKDFLIYSFSCNIEKARD